jgi:hypothetical protein
MASLLKRIIAEAGGLSPPVVRIGMILTRPAHGRLRARPRYETRRSQSQPASAVNRPDEGPLDRKPTTADITIMACLTLQSWEDFACAHVLRARNTVAGKARNC